MDNTNILSRLKYIAALCEGAYLASENNAFSHIAEELTQLVCDINFTEDHDNG